MDTLSRPDGGAPCYRGFPGGLSPPSIASASGTAAL